MMLTAHVRAKSLNGRFAAQWLAGLQRNRTVGLALQIDKTCIKPAITIDGPIIFALGIFNDCLGEN